MTDDLNAVAEKTGMELDFDPNKLRDKYRDERDRRVRQDGNQQYQDISGKFAHFIDDPYVEPGFTREPLFDEVEVLVIGGGFGGLLAGARLREAGVKSLRIIEKGGDFGGTWYWNRYPGAQCDVEAYVYLPLLEEMNYIPKERYSHAPEIMAHTQAIGRKYDLYDDALFQTEVTGMEWDEADEKWIITTTHGDRMKARFVAMSNGPLNRPKLPAVAGIEDFKGHTFHTSRWDYDYTGGNNEGNLTGLKDKRVAIIGTGATAIQCISFLGESSKELLVFQRTPSSVDVRKNAPTDPEWVKKLRPGWHQKRVENFNVMMSGGQSSSASKPKPQKKEEPENEVDDGWTDIFRSMSETESKRPELVLSGKEKGLLNELSDQKKMQEIRDRAAAIVDDPDTAEALKAYYRQACKRPTFHDEYLQTYNLPNVTLVDTLGQGVDRITEKGILFNGKEYEVDCIIFATGFEVGTNYTNKSGYDIVGRNKVTLSDKWADGLKTFHGFFSNGFPNCFFIGMTQTGLTANMTHMLNEQAQHVAHIIDQAKQDNVSVLEATEEAETEWVDEIMRLAKLGESFYAACTPGYYNNEGQPGGGGNGFLSGQYGRGPVEFFKILKQWREDGKMQGLKTS
ncbi:MAG: NAD(P)/FAD-dependent oxidoreductase [Pseudomonadales bacterium]|nr:NAD(P)/FAD-dependent oxidoreductase [Pseudomonadales bacterium]